MLIVHIWRKVVRYKLDYYNDLQQLGPWQDIYCTTSRGCDLAHTTYVQSQLLSLIIYEYTKHIPLKVSLVEHHPATKKTISQTDSNLANPVTSKHTVWAGNICVNLILYFDAKNTRFKSSLYRDRCILQNLIPHTCSYCKIAQYNSCKYYQPYDKAVTSKIH